MRALIAVLDSCVVPTSHSRDMNSGTNPRNGLAHAQPVTDAFHSLVSLHITTCRLSLAENLSNVGPLYDVVIVPSLIVVRAITILYLAPCMSSV
eukprot:scaffold15638_cov86-Skeletonema_marinoi.AAC.2